MKDVSNNIQVQAAVSSYSFATFSANIMPTVYTDLMH